MNRPDALERQLTTWFVETASPRIPDYTDDIVRSAVRARQRPRWSFPDRWLPRRVAPVVRFGTRPLPWRSVGLLAALVLSVAALAGTYVGSIARLPPPFGLAANGLVAYADQGDIVAVDPISGERIPITSGPAVDTEPRWSLDGTRLAFLRESGPEHLLVVVDLDRPGQLVASDASVQIDTDGIEWSPDGRSIMFAGRHRGTSGLHIMDTGSGVVTNVAVDFEGEAHWRPPDGRQLMFVAQSGTGPVVRLLDLADLSVSEIARPATRDGFIRPTGWTPDGRRAVYMTAEPDGTEVTHVVDLQTGDEVRIDAAFAHVSNDGSRVVGLDRQGRMCVASTTGGACRPIGTPALAYPGTTRASVQWSPDDRWVLVRPGSGDRAVILDPIGMTLEQPGWLSLGGASWQRRAP